MDKNGRIQSVDRAISILKCFSEDKRELKLAEISEQLDVNKSTVHGILSTLKYHGLIDQDEETQKYRLGLYLLELGNIVIASLDIRDIAARFINDICQKVNETVHLGMLDGDEVIYIDKKESNQSMRIFTTIGARNPAYCTGIGKAMLAFTDSDKINKIIPEKLERYTQNTITNKKDLLEALQIIRNIGYAIDNEEKIEGLICVAAPIFNHEGKSIYSISVSGPTVRMTEEKQAYIIDLVKQSAMEISLQLGYKKQ